MCAYTWTPLLGTVYVHTRGPHRSFRDVYRIYECDLLPQASSQTILQVHHTPCLHAHVYIRISMLHVSPMNLYTPYMWGACKHVVLYNCTQSQVTYSDDYEKQGKVTATQQVYDTINNLIMCHSLCFFLY